MERWTRGIEVIEAESGGTEGAGRCRWFADLRIETVSEWEAIGRVADLLGGGPAEPLRNGSQVTVIATTRKKGWLQAETP